MEVERKIHHAWEEWQKIPLKIKKKFLCGVDGYTGKYHYIYTSEKGQISLVKLRMGFGSSWMWEILCFKKNLFEDVERFTTKKEAEKRIKELLE